jgi:hypothetical protein
VIQSEGTRVNWTWIWTPGRTRAPAAVAVDGWRWEYVRWRSVPNEAARTNLSPFAFDAGKNWPIVRAHVTEPIGIRGGTRFATRIEDSRHSIKTDSRKSGTVSEQSQDCYQTWNLTQRMGLLKSAFYVKSMFSVCAGNIAIGTQRKL